MRTNRLIVKPALRTMCYRDAQGWTPIDRQDKYVDKLSAADIALMPLLSLGRVLTNLFTPLPLEWCWFACLLQFASGSVLPAPGCCMWPRQWPMFAEWCLPSAGVWAGLRCSRTCWCACRTCASLKPCLHTPLHCCPTRPASTLSQAATRLPCFPRKLR